MNAPRPTKEQMLSALTTPHGERRLFKLQEEMQRQRDECAARLDRYYKQPCPSDAAAERARVIAEVETLRDVYDSVLADCAEVLGSVQL